MSFKEYRRCVRKLKRVLIKVLAIEGLFGFLFLLINLGIFLNVNARANELRKKEKEISAREQDVSARETDVFYHEQEVSIREKRISNLQYELALKDSLVNELGESINSLNGFLDDKLNTLKEQAVVLDNRTEFVSGMLDEVLASDGMYIPSPEEIDNLCKLIYAEAGNQPYEGMVAVAEVVFNRIRSEQFPDTINEVIFAPGQFSPCSNGGIKSNGRYVSLNSDVSGEIKQAVLEAWSGSNITEAMLKKEALSRGVNDPSYWEGGALYFANPRAVSNSSTKNQILSSQVKVSIQDHVFRRR